MFYQGLRRLDGMSPVKICFIHYRLGKVICYWCLQVSNSNKCICKNGPEFLKWISVTHVSGYGIDSPDGTVVFPKAEITKKKYSCPRGKD